MKCIIAGSRSIEDYRIVFRAIEASEWADEITEVVCGMARGVDAHGHTWAIDKGIPMRSFFPNWSTYGKAAGPMRNKAMAIYADALILVWNGKSKGSANMKTMARLYGLRIYEYIVTDA